MGEKRSSAVRYQLRVLLRVRRCVRFQPRSIIGVFTVSPLSAPVTPSLAGARQPLLNPLTDGNRNSSTNRHLLAHRGAVAPLLCPLASYFVGASGQNKLAKNHREIKFGIIRSNVSREMENCVHKYILLRKG